MLIRFAVENFLSFKEEVEFTMLGGDYKNHKTHVYVEKEGIDLLKTAAIYGANGAGKSNFALAIETAQKLIRLGTMNLREALPHHFFSLDNESHKLPTKFEFEVKTNGQIYAYGIAFFRNRIKEEWLYKTHPNREDELVFERETSNELKTVLKLNEKYTTTDKDKLKIEIYEDEIRPNEPFITEAHEKDLVFIKEIYNWFDKVLEVIFPDSEPSGLFENLIFHKQYQKFTNQLLKLVETGVQQVDVQSIELDKLFGLHESDRKEETLKWLDKKMVDVMEGENEIEYGIYLDENEVPRAVKLITKHQLNGKETIFDLIEESEGTQRYIALTPAFIDTIFKGKVYIVDEINRSMHPHMVQQLIKMYLGTNTQNSKGQLVFTTHESNLLDLKLFRQDEIWFIEKNKSASSTMYSLSDFKPHYGSDIRKGYLNGRFGAIPFMADLQTLNW